MKETCEQQAAEGAMETTAEKEKLEMRKVGEERELGPCTPGTVPCVQEKPRPQAQLPDTLVALKAVGRVWAA